MSDLNAGKQSDDVGIKHFWFHYIIILSVNLSSVVLGALWLLYAHVAEQEDDFYRPAFEMYRVLHQRISQNQLSPELMQALGEYEGFRLAIVNDVQLSARTRHLQYVQHYGNTVLYYMPGGGGYYSVWPISTGGVNDLSLIIADQYQPNISVLGQVVHQIKKQPDAEQPNNADNSYSRDYAADMAQWQWFFPSYVQKAQLLPEFAFIPEHSKGLGASIVWVITANLFVIAWLLSRLVYKLTQTHNALYRATNAWAKGEFEHRITDTSFTMKSVIDSLNHMAEQLSALMREQFVMVYAISHELTTPQHKMRLAIELLKLKLQPKLDDSEVFIIDLQRYLAEMEQLTSSILGFAKLSSLQQLECKDDIELASMIEQRSAFISILYPDVAVDIRSSESLSLISNRFYLQLALDNVLKNACKYADSQIIIELNQTDTHFDISIADDGEGLSDEQCQAVMSAFVQSDNAQGMGGFGLGLAIVGTVMAKLSGSMVLSRSSQKGLLVRLSIPF